mgnify:CR=1 FL=1
MTPILIPLAEILPDALPRDRTQLDPEAMTELIASVASTFFASLTSAPLSAARRSISSGCQRCGCTSGTSAALAAFAERP